MTISDPHPADHLFARRWGIMCHFLGAPPSTKNSEMTAEDWQREVDHFDVDGLAAQLAQVKAGYLLLTLGQGSGHYCAPNETYDAIVGIRPSKCAHRDLIGDMANALAPHGIDLVVYSNGSGPWADHEARKALGIIHNWNDPGGWGGFDWKNSRNVAFARHWEAIHREWSLRWGNKVKGWWIDGCYEPLVRFPDDEEPNFRSFKAALRAGNPHTVVAFNSGVKYPAVSTTAHEDFVVGEGESLLEVRGPWVEKDGHRARNHVLSFLGSFWNGGDQPRFPDDLAVAYSRYVVAQGALLTWDVPILRSGLLASGFLPQLEAIGAALGRTEAL